LKEYKEGTEKLIREINPLVDENHTVLLKGLIISMGDIEYVPVQFDLRCSNCTFDKLVSYKEDYDNWRNPQFFDRCDRCGIPLIIRTTKERMRRFEIQEVGITNPYIITCYIFGESVTKIEPSEEIRIKGTVRATKIKREKYRFRPEIDVELMRLEKEKKIMPTQDEINLFKNMDREKIISSFAPHIQNMKLCKEALFIASIGGNKTENSRGDVNVFLVGDPGTAKTQLLKFTTKIKQKSDYVSGRSSSMAGLLAGVDNLSDGTRVVKAGAVVLNDEGLVAIDEMDKMNPMDVSGLHESMESQEFNLAKIGRRGTWKARTVIVGAANPKGGSKWNPAISIKDNTKLSDSLLSRFGIIILVRDIPNTENDHSIGSRILRTRREGTKQPLDTELLLKYVNYIQTFTPTPTEESDCILLDWWEKLRHVKQGEGAVAVDNRVLEDLGRIAEAYAKWRMSETVSTRDAQDAIRLLNQSLHTLGMNTPGERAESLTESMNKNDFTRFVFSEPKTKDQILADLMKEYRFFPNVESAEKEVKKLETAALISCGMDGLYRWV
jgi:DNA replicative helicase MCM subunit Mcm2 (Cdc46/Mcm family)